MEPVLKKSDIKDRKDIELLVNTFYKKMLEDPLMKTYFQLDHWETHITRTVNFWENWLFDSKNYHGGLLWAHIQKHKEIPIKTPQFEKWLAYWFSTVEELFQGPRADFTKTKALELGQFLNHRLQHV